MTVKTRSRVVWTCVHCGEAVADGDGYLCVSYPAMFAYKREVEEHDARLEAAHPEWEGQHLHFVSLVEFVDYPDLVPWEVMHQKCDPDPERNDYWIAVERIRTAAQVIHWAAHLSGKNWIGDTTWSSVLKGVASQLGGGFP